MLRLAYGAEQFSRRLTMTDEVRQVLEFIGRQGKTPEAIAETFPGFDIERLIRVGLVELRRIALEETQDPRSPSSPAFQQWYVLTPRGAEAVDIDARTLHMA